MQPEAISTRPPLSSVKTLLASAGLPTEDLTEQHCDHFFYVGSADAPQGIVGLEIYDDVALLRSLVVVPGGQRKGVGSALLAHAESAARDAGVRAIYLLTTTAEHYFVKCGYHRTDRDSAPSAIRSTREFAGICPASSAFMTRAI